MNDHVVQQAAASMCRRLYVLSEIVCRQNRVIFVSFWVQRSLQMDIHVSRDGNWIRHTGECCQQCGKLVEERRRSWLRTWPVYNDEDVVWLLPPEVVRQNVYSNVVVFCLSSTLDKATP